MNVLELIKDIVALWRILIQNVQSGAYLIILWGVWEEKEVNLFQFKSTWSIQTLFKNN